MKDPSSTRWGERRAGFVVPVLLLAAVVGLLLPAAMRTPIVAVAGAGALGVIILAGVLGAHRASVVMLVLAFGFAPLTSFTLGFRPFVLASVLFGVAFALDLPRLIHERLRLPSMWVVGALLFTIMGLVVVPLALSPWVSLAYLLTAVIAMIVMPAVFVWMRPTERQMFAMAVAFGVGAAVSTAIGLPRNEFRNSGFTYHPVALAYTCMLALSLLPFMMASKVRGRWLWIVPIAALALIGTWTSGSRTGLLVLAAFAVLVPLMERSIMLFLTVTAGIVIAIPKVLAYDPSGDSTSALSRLLGAGGAENSDSSRLTTLQDAWHQIQSNPLLGNGYSTEHTYVIHNVYLQALAAEGVIGLMGLLLMFASLISALRSSVPTRRYLAYPTLAVILAGPFQPNMGDHYLGMCLGLSLWAALGYREERRSEASVAPEPIYPRGLPKRAESATVIG